MKAILNYSTGVDVNKTIGEIQTILGRHGNIQVLTQFEQGLPASISFRLQTAHGQLSFILPANVGKTYDVMRSHAKIPGKLKTREQAARVAWRIIKDWIEAQMAFIQTGQVAMEQLFLPFVQGSNGQTLYETLESGGFKNLTLPAPK